MEKFRELPRWAKTTLGLLNRNAPLIITCCAIGTGLSMGINSANKDARLIGVTWKNRKTADVDTERLVMVEAEK